VVEAVLAGDAVAERIWGEVCEALAVACVTVQHVLNPARIVIGGGLSGGGERLLEPLRARYAQMGWRLAEDAAALELSRLGNDAGWIGAAALLFEAAGGG